jgi:DNA-binding NarL/FixJ family response regulator
MKVLLVDTGDKLRSRMVDALSEIEGLEVSATAQGADGVLRLMVKAPPDVVVLDIQMVNGAIDLVHAIKSTTHAPVVIALSSSSSIQYRAACHNAGAEFFFDKAREQERLIEAVADLQKELG